MMTITCPCCGIVISAQISVLGRGRMPTNGDVSVCANCQGVGIYDFTTPTVLRLPTAEENAVIAHSPDVQAAIAQATFGQ